MRKIVLGALVLSFAIPSRADESNAFSVGTASAARGQKAIGAIDVPAGVDSGTRIAVAVVNGARPGPVLAVVSGAHGTEYASIIAVSRLIERIDPAALSGTVILVPLVNVASFEQKVYHVNPIDRKSINRYYPGNPSGTQTERASWLITTQVVEQSDHLIDLHGGDLDENLRPYSSLDRHRQCRSGLHLPGDGPGLRAGPRDRLQRPSQGSRGLPVSREHRDDPRQAVDHRRGRARRHGRARRRRGPRGRLPLRDAASEDAAGRAGSRRTSRCGSRRSSRP